MTALDWSLIAITVAGMITAGVGVALYSRREPQIVNPEDGLPKTPIGRLRAAIEAGDWQLAGPAVLLMGGMVTFMISGALALIITAGSTRGGGSMLLVAIAAVVKLVWDWRRAA